MPEKQDPVGRRDFLRKASAAGVIGAGERGSYVASMFQKVGDQNNSCDVYEKRKRENAAKYRAVTVRERSPQSRAH